MQQPPNFLRKLPPPAVRNLKSSSAPIKFSPPRIESCSQLNANNNERGVIEEKSNELKKNSTLSEVKPNSVIREEAKEVSKSRAYRPRNVYKSIIRHIYSYTRKHCRKIIKVLSGLGYSREDIEHAFFEIGSYIESKKNKAKCKFFSALQKMVEHRSIYTYILKETLTTMIDEWKQGNRGKIAEENLDVYRSICVSYYKDAVRVIANAV